jgi:hypothetical protein
VPEVCKRQFMSPQKLTIPKTVMDPVNCTNADLPYSRLLLMNEGDSRMSISGGTFFSVASCCIKNIWIDSFQLEKAVEQRKTNIWFSVSSKRGAES